ncbi:MlaD family protein [Gordonia sp. PKS22-38]|uniref:MlaD family protein n=1 Tax=Gordonia prachuapensis TaxID=3115651 RepID=A0ABU7MNR2_9ACTN|nr:MlaD family protein [Gordonia sp. PKS22-38]
MAEFRIPGMSAEPATYRRRALAFLAGVTLLVGTIVVVEQAIPDDSMQVTMSTSTVAGGIQAGASVVLNGSQVGRVTQVSVPVPDVYEVTLELDPERLGDSTDVLTDTAMVSYAPENLFGIAAVVLYGQPGGDPLRDGSTFSPPEPQDATLTTLLHNLSDLQNEAFDPYVGDVLDIANQATQGLLPLFGAVGQIASDVADTQVVTPRETLPQYTQLIAQVRGTVDDLLPGIKQIMDWQAPREPGYLERSQKGLEATAGPFIDDLTRLLADDALGQTAPLMPVITEVLQRVQDTFPDARRNGIQIATLIERLRRSLPDAPGGPVLNVDVVLKSAPGLAAALGLPATRTGGGQR